MLGNAAHDQDKPNKVSKIDTILRKTGLPTR